ncbi:MAG: DEAD/DEAH box helicase family protein [Thermodesulfovibrionales bacterium]
MPTTGGAFGKSSGSVIFMAATAAKKRRNKPIESQLSFEDLLGGLLTVPATTITTPPAATPVPATAPAVKTPVSRNYHITDKDLLGVGNIKSKYRDNVTAIGLLKELEGQNCTATPEEQAVLVKYVGWGGMPQAFDRWNDDWDKEYEELKGLLTEEEYESAETSTLNAHYTSATVIEFMYDAIERLGVKGGRFIEPALGIGHFFGLMPEALHAHSKLSGVELDSISGRIAKQLHPDADIRISGFENCRFPRNFFDVAISNVPFGDYKIHDPAYNKHKFSIHEYFFAKALDIVRPGGIVAFITSRYLMDKKDTKTRKYIAERADLLGAVRLPSSAFKKNANTEVTADILFFQKREAGAVPAAINWTEIVPFPMGKDECDAEINEYFAQRPQLMLGKLIWATGMYGRYDVELAPDKRDLKDALAGVLPLLPDGVVKPTETVLGVAVEQCIPAPDHVKEGAYVVHEGKLYRSMADELVLQELPVMTARRVESMIQIRDIVRKLLHDELTTGDDAGVDFLRGGLNTTYDSFVKKFGFLSLKANRAAFREDPDYPLLLSLEVYDDETKTAEKAEIFSRRVIHPVKRVSHVASAKEAFLVTMNERGVVDFERMAELSDLSEEELRTELEGIIFRNPEGGMWEAADAYLSGNVRKKLEAAELAVLVDPEFHRNVTALKTVQPKDLDFTEIHANLGAAWIPPKDVELFVNYLIDVPGGCEVEFSPVIGSWTLEPTRMLTSEVLDSVNNTTKFGTARCDAVTLIRLVLNNRIPTIKDTIRVKGEEKEVVNVKETEAAREKQLFIKERFRTWIWEDADRRERLAKLYNETFNCLRPRTFDGSHLTLPGMSNHLELKPHQKDAIWRIIQSGNTLLDHKVGAGKTFCITAAAMEMRRLGLVSKPVIVVPNHLIEQWAAEFLRLYPLANILITGHDDFTAQKRKAFIGKIATNNWDAVIIGHSSFERIPLSQEAIEEFISLQIADLEDAVLAAQSNKSDSKIVKQLQKAKRRLEAKLKERANEEKKDNGLTFEDLGIDFLATDESDLYKNLYFVTKMDRIAGLPNADSKRAFDMYMKARLLNSQEKSVVFSTGTPISNTLAEMYTVQRYLQPHLLAQYNLSHFDSWAATFGEVVTSLEITPTGAGYRMRSRFAKFVNVPELLQMYRQTADVQHDDDVLGLEKPEMEDGKPIVIVAPPSEAQEEYVQSLVERAERLKKERVDPREDNMLKITGDGRKAGLDLRLVDPPATDFPDSKVNMAVQQIYDIWSDTEDSRGTQLVFCDLSTPKKAGFNVYRDIREKLVKRGVPKQEIVFVHEADTDAKKKVLWTKVNFGKVRILMGSTEKMGAGTNVQRLCVALHHLDAPWRPRDVDQREGRILRQGNTNKTVSIFRYVTRGSFDAYIWQLIEAKSRFIAQIRSGDSTARVAEDIEGVVLSYAEVKALSSGNPLVMEKFKVDIECDRLETLRSQHASEQWRLKREMASLEARIERYTEIAANYEADIAVRETPEPFSIKVDGSVYSERKAAGDAIVRMASGRKGSDAYDLIGSYAGFELYLRTFPFGYSAIPQIIARGLAEHKGNVSDSDIGTISSLEYAVRTIEERHAHYVKDLGDMKKRLEGLSLEVGQPFPMEEQLRHQLLRQAEINKELDVDNRDTAEETTETVEAEEESFALKEAA